MYPQNTTFPTFELWLPVVGWEGWYEVSNMGRVRRIKPGQGTKADTLKQQMTGRGYPCVGLCRDGHAKRYPIHVLVANAFHGLRPDGYEPNHKNANRLDARPENLEWITRRENRGEAVRTGRWKAPDRRGSANSFAKLTEQQIKAIRATQDKTPTELATIYGCDVSNIRLILRRKTWTNI